MPEIRTMFDFDSMSPPELEQRRRDITSDLQKRYGTHEALASTSLDDEGLDDLLKELAALTSTLRRRTSGPPKTAKTAGGRRKSVAKTVDDI